MGATCVLPSVASLMGRAVCKNVIALVDTKSVLYRNHDRNRNLSYYFAQECSQCSLYVLDDQHLADAFGVVYCYPVSASEEYRKQAKQVRLATSALYR